MKKKQEKKPVRKEKEEKPSSEPIEKPSPEKKGDRGEEASHDAPGQEVLEEAILPEELKALREKAGERDEFLEKLKRARADYANYQKRMEREKESLTKFLLQDFFFTLLPVVDNLHRAIGSTEESKDFDKFLEGVKMVERQFLKVLENGGVKPIQAKGKAFDPAFHEAALQVENEEVPNNTVLEEIEKGYLFHDRVLRASKVIVSKKKQEAKESEKEKAEDQSESGEGEVEPNSDQKTAASE